MLTDAQRAAVTDPVSKNLLQYIPLANTTEPTAGALIGSALAPVNIDQYTIDSRHNLRQNDDLHGYYAFQKDFRQEPNAQGNTVPGFGDTRGGHRQVMTVNETHVFSQALVNEVRVGYNRISISFDPQRRRRPDATSASTSAVDRCRSRCRRSRSPGLGLNFGGPAGFPSGRDGDDVRARRHGDLPARQSHHQVRRRVPAASKHYSFNGDPGHVHVSERRGVPAGLRQRVQHHARRSRRTTLLRQRGRRLRPGLRSRSDSNLKLDLGLRYDFIGRRRPKPTTSWSSSTPATSSLVQIGIGGFDQVHKNGSDFQPRARRHLESDRRRQDWSVRGAYAVMVNQSNTGYVTGATGNPPLATPLSAQAAGTAASNVKLDSAVTRPASRRSRRRSPTRTSSRAGCRPGTSTSSASSARIGLMVGYFGSHGDRLRIPININQFVNRRHRASVPEAVGDEPDLARRDARQHHRGRRASAGRTTRASGSPRIAG